MKPTVLLVMDCDRRQPLLEKLEACDLNVMSASDCDEARRILQRRPRVDVLLTDEVLRDGRWLRNLEEVRRNEIEAETIVCTRVGDPGLWIHVLTLGAYDLLVPPYDKQELRRIIEGAAAQRCMTIRAVAS